MTILSLLAIYGVMFATRHASILDVPRTWLTRRSRFAEALLSCSFCTGFHAGWFVFALSTNPRVWTAWDAALWAFAGATFSYALDVALLWVEARTPKKEPHVVPLSIPLSSDQIRHVQDAMSKTTKEQQVAWEEALQASYDESKNSSK